MSNKKLVLDDSELYSLLIDTDNPKAQTQAFDYIYQHFYRQVLTLVTQNNGSQSDAVDTFHQAITNFFISIKEEKYSYTGLAAISSYIYRYSKYIWLNELRRRKIRPKAEYSEDYQIADKKDLVKELERKEKLDAIAKALGQLKDGCREIIEWFYIDELRQREIAEKLGINEPALKQRKYSCTKQLIRITRGIYPDF
ncbi:RNA polymerase sigma factor [Dyadobacter psychrotolerans]|uniref:Sigma-70 family RNA polymerase sigma factor n=1 Tax=Dyadobacter psychrotolerans TaxID=2541721 RepID=A0A4R5D4G2_9BACT|nr:sigma-70 family RNA polymerase sigma factor [Dyadobacter psychrotolerans]TDE08292.1 sigma-70 family RNA polymerase sigma factor [Dyadobacter psychrotolerans]